MKPYNRYLIALTVTLSASVVVLIAYGVQRLNLYLSLNIVGYLIVTLLFAYLHSRARRILDKVGYVLFAGFLVVVALRMIALPRLVRL